jgi:hypothetical protein
MTRQLSGRFNNFRLPPAVPPAKLALSTYLTCNPQGSPHAANLSSGLVTYPRGARESVDSVGAYRLGTNEAGLPDHRRARSTSNGIGYLRAPRKRLLLSPWATSLWWFALSASNRSLAALPCSEPLGERCVLPLQAKDFGVYVARRGEQRGGEIGQRTWCFWPFADTGPRTCTRKLLFRL